jgi:sugar lactone lactonase YvrE
MGTAVLSADPARRPMLLSDDDVSVFFDGMLTEPRLDHPEGVAVHPDGSVWCGGERGQIFRLDPDGTRLDEVASTGGFCVGMAFDAGGDLFVCDLGHAAVFRLEVASGRLERFSGGAPGRPFRIPNFPAFDAAGRLYVSDSHAFRDPGPGVFRIEPDGRTELWWGRPLDFANGLAFSPDGSWLYVVETFASAISRIAVRADGGAGALERVLTVPEVFPDGLAFDLEGNLYVGCYEPSQVLRIDPDGDVRVLYREISAHTLAHPTNVAFRGSTLFTANLGRWHLTRLEVGIAGISLPPAGP